MSLETPTTLTLEEVMKVMNATFENSLKTKEDIVSKRKHEDLELTMLEQEIITMKQSSERLEQDIIALKLANKIRAEEHYANLLSNKDNLDERARLIFMDNWLKLASVENVAHHECSIDQSQTNLKTE